MEPKMSKKTPLFDAAAKARVMRIEVAKYGHVRPDSFGSYVQSVVDKMAATPNPTTKKLSKRKH
jgi:hypothetical protein